MRKRKKWMLATGIAVFMLVSGVPNLIRDVDVAWAATIPGTWIQAADGRWWYKHNDGTYTKNDWESIDEKWYFFDESGWMVTGWKKVDGKWFYLNPEKTDKYVKGEMLTGWQKVAGRWYYLNPVKTDKYVKGEMLTDWKKVDGKWYYLSPVKTDTFNEGEMVTGWLTLDGKKYYMDADGVMQTGEVIMNGKKYYFAETGELVSEETIQEATPGELIALAALNNIDTPFQWDGKNLSTGCDNDGFLYCIMDECGYSVSESIQEQQNMGTAVTQDELKPGDVIIYSGDSKLGGIYLGENKVIYAAGLRWGVRITTLQHPGTPITCRRIW